MSIAEQRRMEAFNNDAVWARFYRDGKSLGEIAEEFGGTIYTYSPWLTAPIVRSVTAALAKNTDSPPPMGENNE